MYRNCFKRLFDILVSFSLLMLLWPVLLAVAIGVRVTMGSPVCFTQVRPGYKGKLFKLIKFRSMVNDTVSDGQGMSDGMRLTKLGSILRKLSLDELPQLWLVLKGEMSLIGPRPLLVEYLEKYTEEQARRHDVRPGITGLAQVLGRHNIPFSKRLALDVEYVDKLSLGMDIYIFFKTIAVVFTSSDNEAVQDISAIDDLGFGLTDVQEDRKKVDEKDLK